jgi:tetratricopeptide (TPR) repeat protein
MTTAGAVSDGSPHVMALLPYRVAFAIGVGLFGASLVWGLAYVVRVNRSLPGFPPDLLSDYKSDLASGALRRAALRYRVATRISPTSFPHAAELAEAMRRAGDVEGELEQYRIARDRWPRDAATHRALGLAYSRHRRFDESVVSLNEALRVDPGDAKTYLALGDTRLEQGRFAEAVQSFAQAVAQDAGNALAHNSLGIALALSGDPARAAAAFAEAVRLDANPQYAANLERARRDIAGGTAR